MDGKVYFYNQDVEHGDELWVVDGDEVYPTAELRPGPASSLWSLPVVYEGRVYFVGFDEAHGLELWAVDPTLTPTEPAAPTADAATILAAFPNPAREAVTVRYALERPQPAALEVVDMLGRRVRRVEQHTMPAGTHETRVETAGLPSGLYLVRLFVDSAEADVRRVSVVR